MPAAATINDPMPILAKNSLRLLSLQFSSLAVSPQAVAH